MSSPNYGVAGTMFMNNNSIIDECVPIAWDGSYLGEFPPLALIRFQIGTLRIGRLLTGVCTITGIISAPNSTLPCVLDQLKPLFGLASVGCHSFKIKGRIYILQKLISEGEAIYFDHPLIETIPAVQSLLLDQRKRLSIFRSICGIRNRANKNDTRVRYDPYKFSENSIQIIGPSGYIGLVSYGDVNVARHEDELMPLEGSILELHEIDYCVQKFLGIGSYNDLVNFMLNVEEVFNRIAPDKRSYMSLIQQNIQKRLT